MAKLSETSVPGAAPSSDPSTSKNVTREPIEFGHEDAPVASVIVIAWRSAPHIRACLASLKEHLGSIASEVVLVLNEPDEDLVRLVNEETRGITTLVTRVNVGYGGAVNLAVARSRGEFVVLLNDDAEITENWLETLIATARRRPKAAVVGSTTLFPDGTIQEAGSVVWADGSTVKVGRGLARTSRRYDYERRVDHCSGTSLLVRRSIWDALGGMDAERYYPAYYEDTDFCLRVLEYGEQVWYQPRSFVRHIESASTTSLYRDFLFERNRAAFVNRWHERLRNQVMPTNRDDAEVAEAVWRAMGRPVRVFVAADGIDGELAVLERLQEQGRCHLAVSSHGAVADGEVLCARGIELVEEQERDGGVSLGQQSGSRFDLAIDLRGRGAEFGSVAPFGAMTGVPVARLATSRDDEILVDIAGISDRGPSMNWHEVVDAVERGTRAPRGSGEGS